MIERLPVMEHDFSAVSSMFFVLLFARMFQVGTYRHFPWIMSYQCIQWVLVSSATLFGTSSVLYARVYEYSSLPLLLASILVAYELITNLYTLNPGLKVFNRRSLRIGILLAFISAVPSAYSTHARWHDPDFACLLWVWLEATRVTEIGLVVYLAKMLIASKKLHVQFSRDLTIFSVGFILLFTVDAITSTLGSALKLQDAPLYILSLLSVSSTILFSSIGILGLQPQTSQEVNAVKLDASVLSRLDSLGQVITSSARSRTK